MLLQSKNPATLENLKEITSGIVIQTTTTMVTNTTKTIGIMVIVDEGVGEEEEAPGFRFVAYRDT